MDHFRIMSEAFIELRDSFDSVLEKTIATMMSKDSDESTLTLKLNINLTRDSVIDKNAPEGVRAVIRPEFSHKVSSVMQIKQEEQGKTEQQYELVWDELRKEFGMKPIGSQQMTF